MKAVHADRVRESRGWTSLYPMRGLELHLGIQLPFVSPSRQTAPRQLLVSGGEQSYPAAFGAEPGRDW
ncbi:MAG TPA: hypothetical protein VGD59_15220 [Acidisarcina sp.]